MTVIELYRREDGSEVLVTTYHHANGTKDREIAVRPTGSALWSPPLKLIRIERERS